MSTMLIPETMPTTDPLDDPPPITREQVEDLRWVTRQAVDEIAFDLYAEGTVPSRYGGESMSHLMRLLEVMHLLGNETEEPFPGSPWEIDGLNRRARVLTPERIGLLLAETAELEKRISWILFEDDDDRDERDARSREEFHGAHMARALNARLTLERMA